MANWSPWVTILVVVALVLAILWLVGVRFNLDASMIVPYGELAQ